VIYLNEGGESVALRFSDPDGVCSGKSGWSFGGVQWDTKNNPKAIDCLVDCGFTQEEIKGIITQTIDVRPLAIKLIANKAIIEKYDAEQLKYCIDAAVQFSNKYHIPVSNTECLLALADTVNQYGSLGSGSAAYLQKLGRPVNASDVLAMKLTWKYSKTEHGKEDTERRAANIAKVVSENA